MGQNSNLKHPKPNKTEFRAALANIDLNENFLELLCILFLNSIIFCNHLDCIFVYNLDWISLSRVNQLEQYIGVWLRNKSDQSSE